MSFTKDQRRSRLERFCSFLQDQHFLHYEVPYTGGGKQVLIVYTATELAKVELSYTGKIEVTARNGRLRGCLLHWIAQESPVFYDLKKPENFRELDTYSYLLQSSPSTQPSSGRVRMYPTDNDIVALAEELGYQVYLVSEEGQTGTAVRYHIVSPQGRRSNGNNMVQTMASLLKQDLER